MGVRKDATAIGWLGKALAGIRTGRWRGLEPLARAAIFEPVLKEVVAMAEIRREDNVALLGAADLRPVPWIAPGCRELIVVDDLPEAALASLQAEHRAKGAGNVRFLWGPAERLPVPQYTVDRVLSVNHLFRARDPRVAAAQIGFVGRHGTTIVCCEPSASLDSRTARKYSREADLGMEEHRALIAYARSAGAWRSFTREGLASLLEEAGAEGVRVRDLMHGLVVAATATIAL